MEILEIKGLTLAEAKEIVVAQSKSKKELSIAEGKINDFFNKTTVPSVKIINSQREKLEALVLPSDFIVQLLDLQPQDTDDLRLAISKQLVDYDKSMQEKILNVFKE
ncbi:MAG: hypothetical protein CVU81_02075 [Euryarchaeota archaeon HGW-Euryarchaeota-1]|nr:MAG: hypothetical protein CVU81_02075 [Euryarchaeota archaeon HGW-Euryarchaeota-1]